MITSRHRMRMFAAASGLAGLALLGAACGGSDDGKPKDSGAQGGGNGMTRTGADGSGAPSQDQQLKLAKCMREHGVDMPDPKPGEDGRAISIGGNGVGKEKLEAAMKACRKVAGMPPPREMTAAEKDKMIKFAQCMRRNGVDMPDPKFEGGTANAPALKVPRTGAEKEKFEKANKACGSTFG